MINDRYDRLLRLLVRFAGRSGKFDLFGRLNGRKRLLRAGDLSSNPNDDIRKCKANGQHPAQRRCKKTSPMADLPFHQGHG